MDLKLLHVRTDATLRGAVLDLVMAQENHADNRALYFRFDDPVAGPERGWPERTGRLREQWVEKTEAVAPAKIHLAPLAPARGTAATGFAGTLAEAARSLGEPLTGVVAVLAPAQ